MTEILTSAQMRAIEQAAIASGTVTGLELMERAGARVVEAISQEWPELGPGSGATVLCGPGNNGGDGFVVARLLKERGWVAETFLFGDAGKLTPDAQANCERWTAMGGRVHPMSECDSARFAAHPLVVDAVFGTGLTRSIPEAVRSILLATLDCPRVAIDMPSMLSSDTGRCLTQWPDLAPAAQLTVSFHAAKLGHYLADGPRLSGKLVIGDIGLAPWGAEATPADGLQPARLVSQPRTKLGKSAGQHKYHHGHALVLSGGPGRGGAARLAARAALRIGAGLVTIGCSSAALIENAARLDAIMLRRIDDGPALEALLDDMRFNAICLGPGLGTGEKAASLVKSALEAAPTQAGRTRRAFVLDADALTILSERNDLFSRLHSNVVLTPHAGEFARLFPDLDDQLGRAASGGPSYSKVDATRDAAARADCTVLFKGADTIIADETGATWINAAHYDRAAPWLATAGSGDVLAGLVAGLLARGFAPLEAASAAAWLHVEAARSFGPGLIAEDLPEEIPEVLRSMGF